MGEVIGYLVRMSFGRYAEWNPAQQKWSWDAANLTYASILSREDAIAVAKHFWTTRQVDTTVEPDPLGRPINTAFAPREHVEPTAPAGHRRQGAA